MRPHARRGVLAMFFASAGLFGVVLSLLYYLQRCLHLAPLWAGVAFLPFSATVVFASTLGNSFILPRLDGRTVLIAGGVTSAFGLLMLSHIDSHANYYTAILPGLVIGGFGKGLIFGASTHGAATGIRPEESGIASATVNVMHHVGGSLGAALLSSVVASTATFFLARHASRRPSGGGRLLCGILGVGRQLSGCRRDRTGYQARRRQLENSARTTWKVLHGTGLRRGFGS